MHIYIAKHKKRTSQNSVFKRMFLPVSAVTLFMLTISYWNNTSYGLALEYNGQQIAKVSDEKVYEKAENLIRSQVPLREKYKINKVNPKIKIAPVSQEECCKQPELIKNKIIENSNEILNPGFSVYIDDKLIAISESKEEINCALNEIIEKNKCLFENALNAKFEETIEIREGLFSPESMQSYEKLQETFNSKSQTTISYFVSDEDSIVSIAEKFDLEPEFLLAINRKKKEDPIYPGDELKVIISDDLLHVKVTAKKIVENEIPFEILEEKDDDLKKGEIIKSNAGSNGKEEVIYQVQYKNGKEISCEEVDRQVTLDPLPEKIIIGTKQEEYIWPVPYTKNITSPFGPRWGSFHYGIDIAESGVCNQDILASKDGIVEKIVMSNSGYGNYVVINHNDGSKTLYAHCSKICINKNQSVKQGDKIALVGSTGNSTGPHLHFEVIINDKKQDPVKFVK